MAKTTRHLTLPVDPGSYRFLPIVKGESTGRAGSLGVGEATPRGSTLGRE